MKIISAFRKEGIVPNLVSLTVILFFAISIAQAATTLSTNIVTDGTLSVTGASTLTGLTSMGQASSTRLSVFDTAYFGGTATSTFNSAGVLTLITPLAVTSGGTGQTSFGQGWLHSNGTAFTSSTSPTVNYIVSTSTTATSTFAAGLQSTYLNITGTAATSTFARGIDLAGGCFAINGTCVGGGVGTVTSVALSDSNSTLTIGGTPVTTSGTLTATLNLAHGNSWTALQQFSNASSTLFSSYGPSYFGATATSSFDSAGALTLITPLAVTSGGTGQTSFGQGWLHSNGTSFTSSTSPTVNYIVSTSTTATSTFAAGVQTTALNVTSQTATSTFANGISLSGGCIVVGGSCIGGSSASTVVRSARTSDTILAVADQGKLIDVTSGTFSQTFTAAATLGSGWWVYYRNSGTGSITLDPNGTETIDSLTTFIMYPGETRLIQSDGTNLNSVVLKPFYKTITTTDAAFIWPPGYTQLGVDVIGAGGGGGGGRGGAEGSANASGGGGGGGGSRIMGVVTGVAPGTSFAVTIGDGGTGGAGAASGVGTVGVAGGNTTFGTYLTAYGGGGGGPGSTADQGGGGGGGIASAGPNGGAANAAGGGPGAIYTLATAAGLSLDRDTIGGGGGASIIGLSVGRSAEWGGGAGGGSETGITGTQAAGGSSIYGGGGGGAGGGISSGNTPRAGGAGGKSGAYTAGGGGAGGSSGGSVGTAGADASGAVGSGGGGGGKGAIGGVGGVPGGGGGGGGGGFTVNGGGSIGAAGGRGEVRVWGI